MTVFLLMLTGFVFGTLFGVVFALRSVHHAKRMRTEIDKVLEQRTPPAFNAPAQEWSDYWMSGVDEVQSHRRRMWDQGLWPGPG